MCPRQNLHHTGLCLAMALKFYVLTVLFSCAVNFRLLYPSTEGYRRVVDTGVFVQACESSIVLMLPAVGFEIGFTMLGAVGMESLNCNGHVGCSIPEIFV